MNAKKAFSEIVNNPKRLLFKINHRYPQFFSWMDDYTFLNFRWYYYFGEKLNLEDPRTFSEKIQWLKLNDRNPLYTKMVDKYEVKKYVAALIGERYVIPTLGVWNTFDEIDFQSLPDQFVLKCTHDSGGLVICKSKKEFDIQAARRKINHSLKRDYYKVGREWPYKDVPRGIIAEKYLGDKKNQDLRDYKFYCFNGKPLFCQVISDRSSNETVDFYDMQWNLQEFTGLAIPHKPHSKLKIEKPNSFEVMKNSASILSNNMPFARVDFYEVMGRMYFGEITLFPASGFGIFQPKEWNKKLGDMIDIDRIQTHSN